MSKTHALKAFVNERLTAAAEEIFALFERTIEEYEEELRRFANENRRQQRLLDAVMNPKVVLKRAGAEVLHPPKDSHHSLKHGHSQTVAIKQERHEQSVKQEEQPLTIFVPELSAACLTNEESYSLLPGRQTYQRAETVLEDISVEPHFHSAIEENTDHSTDTDSDTLSDSDSDDDCSDTDSGEDSEIPLGCLDVEMETEDCAQNAPEMSTTLNKGKTSGAKGAKGYQCTVCKRRFRYEHTLKVHSRVHAEDNCPICVRQAKNTSSQECKTDLTNNDLFFCPFCSKAFNRMCGLKVHIRVHT